MEPRGQKILYFILVQKTVQQREPALRIDVPDALSATRRPRPLRREWRAEIRIICGIS